jgi:hypothetical protein
MSVKNEWPTANIKFAVVIQKSVVIFLSGDFFGGHCMYQIIFLYLLIYM